MCSARRWHTCHVFRESLWHICRAIWTGAEGGGGSFWRWRSGTGEANTSGRDDKYWTWEHHLLVRVLESKEAPGVGEDLVIPSNGGLCSRIPQNIGEKFRIPENNRTTRLINSCSWVETKQPPRKWRQAGHTTEEILPQVWRVHIRCPLFWEEQGPAAHGW